jgi:hypothetical protein
MWAWQMWAWQMWARWTQLRARIATNAVARVRRWLAGALDPDATGTATALRSAATVAVRARKVRLRRAGV